MNEWVLACLLQACRIASWPAAILHAQLAHLPESRRRSLRACWFAYAVRELLPLVLRTSLRKAALARVFLDRSRLPAGGVVIATIHPSWTKLLSQWCREHRVLVLVRGGWSHELGEAAVGSRFEDLRRIIGSLREGGVLFVAADAFVDREGCFVPFLGELRHASLLPARLARAAGVPIVAAVPVFHDGRITLATGSTLRAHAARDEDAVTRAVMADLEKLILEHPAAWNETLRGGVGSWGRGSRRVGAHGQVDAIVK
jgi:hypothetical protein